MKNRRFECGAFHHVYQRTVNGYNIFYDVEDYLVYYTIFSVMARKYRVRVLGLCLMVDHIHSLIYVNERDAFTKFLSSVTIQFMKEFNRAYGRSGQLFETFGSAPKPGIKLLRTAIAYLYNNPVEKYLCSQAQDYRWNFLSYVPTAVPGIPLRKAAMPLRRALKEVDYTFANGNHISYAQIRRLLKAVPATDKERFIDYIIVRYSVTDYGRLSECYGSYEKALLAINSNAGSEYDIPEVKRIKSDKEFRELHRFVRNNGFLHPGDVICLPDSDKLSFAKAMIYGTSASWIHICKFLHLASTSSSKHRRGR